MKTQPRSWTGLAVGAVVLIFIVVILFMWGVGLFDSSGTQSSAKVIAASLTLVGAIVTASVSIVGIILRHSLDQRNANLAEEAEERLKLEASIRAVGLLGTNNGDPVQPVQRAGALFALTSLGRYELAFHLAEFLFTSEQKELDLDHYVTVLNRVLMFGEPSVQEAVITRLIINIELLLEEEGEASFPRSILDWDLRLSDSAREHALIAMVYLLLARPVGMWKRPVLNRIIVAFSLAWTTEPVERIKNDAGVLLRSIILQYPDNFRLFGPQDSFIVIGELRKETSSLTPIATVSGEQAERLRIWAGGAEEEREAKS